MKQDLVNHRRFNRRVPRHLEYALGLLVAMSAQSCGDDPTAVGAVLSIEFSQAAFDLGTARTGSVEVRNAGTRALGPVEMLASSVTDGAGNVVPGSAVSLNPVSIATLNPGQVATVQVDVTVGALVQSGAYSAELTARAGTDALASVDLAFAVAAEPTTEISALSITTTTTTLRQGDVLQMTTETRDASGTAVAGLPIVWSVDPAHAGYIDASGQIVGYAVGPVTVTAAYGGHSDTHALTLSSRGLTGSATLVGSAVVSDRHSSDLWVHGNYAYTGTWGQRVTGGVARFGDQLHTWDVSDPSDPQRTHTLTVDARTVNDIKVRSDGAVAVLTHEASNDGLNGVTVLDMSDPAQPATASRFTSGLESGIHNVWIEGDYAYLVLDGNGNGLRILDISDPTAPSVVASFYAGSSFLHDVYVRDGIAFLAHWNAGLILLDVGNGIRGGSPTNPIEISRIEDLGGQTHNAWYWPEAGYVFVGEEDFSTPGHMRVVDVQDLEDPRTVASFTVPGATPHNFWLDEDNAVLYLAWYENGLRALDVSGRLAGELDRQGREFFDVQYDGPGGGCVSPAGTCSWAPQVHQGRIYVSDMNLGMVVLQPSF